MAVGIYGLMSFLVGRRTPEDRNQDGHGGRKRGGIFRLVIEHALRLMAIGTIIGIVGAIAAAQALRSLLFSVAPADVLTILIAVVVLGIVARFAAAVVPAGARRQSRSRWCASLSIKRAMNKEIA